MDRKHLDKGAAASSPPATGSEGGASRRLSPGEKIPAGFPPSPGTLDRALGIVSYLRDHCDWDRRQTARTLVPYLLEEAHETAEAIRSGDSIDVRDELGDLLLNVAFQIIVAEEAGHFSREEVIRSLEEKMVRRHPHLFGLGEAESWETIKARERESSRLPGKPAAPVAAGDRAIQRRVSVLDSVSGDSDSLGRAHALQVRASEVGFDWDDVTGALQKTREEVLEVADAIERGSHSEIHEEIGDLLFSVVNLARLARCSPPAALAAANEKFGTRFRAVESLAADRGLRMPGTPLDQLDGLWDEVKRVERREETGGENDNP